MLTAELLVCGVVVSVHCNSQPAPPQYTEVSGDWLSLTQFQHNKADPCHHCEFMLALACTFGLWFDAPVHLYTLPLPHTQMEYGVRQLIPELGCAATLRVVADASGTHVGAALRSRGVLRRVGLIIDRMYPCRLHVSRGVEAAAGLIA